MNFPGTSTTLVIYRVLLVTLCVVALMIWIETIEVLAVVLLACLPGIFDKQLQAQFGDKFYIPYRFIAPYRLFLFIWNGFRSKRR